MLTSLVIRACQALASCVGFARCPRPLPSNKHKCAHNDNTPSHTRRYNMDFTLVATGTTFPLVFTIQQVGAGGQLQCRRRCTREHMHADAGCQWSRGTWGESQWACNEHAVLELGSLHLVSSMVR